MFGNSYNLQSKRLERFKRVLVVLKVAKFNQLALSQLEKGSKLLEDLLVKFEASKSRHEAVCHQILNSMTQFKINFDKISLAELNTPIRDYNLVICLGGDGTFLKAAHYILDDTPIMGINTDPDRSHCSFSCYNPRSYILEPEDLWEKLKCQEYELRSRTRIQIGFFENEDCSKPAKIWENNYALNEVLFADNIVANSSNFRVSADKKDFESYKGSGLIVSTGSGSTGWLKSVLNIEPEIIRDIIWEKEKRLLTDRDANSFATRLASKYYFDSGDKRLFYIVREPVVQTNLDKKKRYKDFANEILVQSAIKNGSIVLDGVVSRDIPFGGLFELKASNHPLTTVHIKF